MLSAGIVKLLRSKQELKAREAKRYWQKATKRIPERSLQRNERVWYRSSYCLSPRGTFSVKVTPVVPNL